MSRMRAGGAAGVWTRSLVERARAMAPRAGLLLAVFLGGAVAASAGTNYFLHVEADGPGRVEGLRDGWYPAGTPIRLLAQPGESGAFVEWSGDVPPGAARKNPLETVLDHSRAFVAHFAERQVALNVASDWRAVAPAPGAHRYPLGASLVFEATAFVSLDCDGVRAACVGWTGTGSIPARGVGIRGEAVLREDSSIRWLWSTQCLVTAGASEGGTVGFSNGWYTVGSVVVLTATPMPGYVFLAWDVDEPPCEPEVRPAASRARVVSGESLRLLVDQPVRVMAHFKKLAPPRIVVTPPALTNLTVLAGGSTQAMLRIRNEGSEPLRVSIAEDRRVQQRGNGGRPDRSDWLRVDPAEGAVAPGMDLLVHVRIDAARAVPGSSLQSALRIASNDPLLPVVMVPVAVRVWTESTTTSSTSTSTSSTTIRETSSSSTSTLTRTSTSSTTEGSTSSTTTMGTTTSSTTTTAPVATGIHYVALNGRHVSPFATLAKAATNIQAAVDVAVAGDEIRVAAGVYQNSTVGAGVSNEYGLARVVIAKPIRVTALAGPAETIIVGSRNADAPVRGAFLTGGARLDGFTLRAGGTLYDNTNGGDEVPFRRYRRASGGGVLAVENAVVSNCVVAGNVADFGGGVACLEGAKALQCVVRGNEGRLEGGGAAAWVGGRVEDCDILQNESPVGGGVMVTYGGQLLRSRVTGNHASMVGGGVEAQSDCLIEGCLISGNSAEMAGGGAYLATSCILRNGLVLDNVARSDDPPLPSSAAIAGGRVPQIAFVSGTGGGVFLEGGRMENCSVAGNWATNVGGGVMCSFGAVAINSIVYNNTSDHGSANIGTMGTENRFSHICSTPAPTGTHNIVANPLFVNAAAGDYRLQPASPCIDTGLLADWMASALDLAGHPRVAGATVDIGSFEYDAALQDSDADGMSDAREWRAGTDPLNRANVLAIQTIGSLTAAEATTDGRSVAVLPSEGMEVRWQATVGNAYAIEFSDRLATGFTTLATQVVADSTEEVFVDTNRLEGVRFYRVRLE